MNTTENNKLIAEFMGFEWCEINKPFIAVRNNNGAIHFRTDWNDLMLVVEKIEGLSHSRGRNYYLFMEQSYVQIRIDRMNYNPFGKWGTSSNKDKLQAVYNACLEFINWYNEQE